jgi:hypothetical protein
LRIKNISSEIDHKIDPRPKLFGGEGSPYVVGLRDTESAENFQTRLSGSRRICVVGNGGIATEIVHEVQTVDIVWAVKVRFVQLLSPLV